MGEAHEIITFFHLNGPKLVMTHYCAAGNHFIDRDRVDSTWSYWEGDKAVKGKKMKVELERVPD